MPRVSTSLEERVGQAIAPHPAPPQSERGPVPGRSKGMAADTRAANVMPSRPT